MNAQKESLKNNFQGSNKLPQAHKKVYDENEKKINDGHLKYFLMEGVYKARVENSSHGYQTTSGQ